MRQLRYTFHQSSLGLILIVASTKGICLTAFVENVMEGMGILKSQKGPHCAVCDDRIFDEFTGKIDAYLRGEDIDLNIPIDITPTSFQNRVWEELMRIPFGEVRTYSQIAQTLQVPNAARAVGGACGSNPICLIIPCHRAVPKGGGFGGFRWGAFRKSELLGLEARGASALIDNRA